MSPKQSKQVVILVVVLALLGVVVFTLNGRSTSSVVVKGSYFYDLQTGKLYAVAAGVEAPAPAPSGGEGVQAVVYACGNCDNPATHVVAFLAKRSEVFHEAAASRRELTSQEAAESTLYRPVDGKEWFKESHPKAAALLASIGETCPQDKPAVVCQP